MNLILTQNNNLILQAKKIKYAGQSIDITNDNQIEFRDNINQNKVFINTKNNQSNIQIDINQLEGKSLNNFTIKNLKSNNIIISSQVDGDFDLEETIDELIEAHKLNQQKIIEIQTQIEANKAAQDQINNIFGNDIQNINSTVLNHTQQIQQLFIDNNNFKAFQTLTEKRLLQIETKNIEQDTTLDAHWSKILEIIALLNEIDASYITKSDLNGLASEASVIGLGITVGAIGIEASAAVAAAATANTTAGSALSMSTANGVAISQLLTEVSLLSTKEAFLEGDVSLIKADNITTKTDLVATKASLNSFIISQGVIDAEMQAQITSLQTTKADKSDLDDYVLKQNDTNSQISTNLLTLSSTKANTTDIYTKTEIDMQQQVQDNLISTKTNISDVFTKTEIISKYYDKIDQDIMFQLKSDSDIVLGNMMSLINNLDQTKVNISDVYTNKQIDTIISTKANISDIYTKTEIDLQQQTQDNLISTKANISDTYTKIQVDSQQKVQNDNISLLQTKDSIQDNDISNMKIDVQNNNTNVQNCMIKVTENTNDIQVIKTDVTVIKQDIVTLKNSSNIPFLEGRLITLENSQIDQNIIINGTKNYLETYMIPEQTTQNNNISTLQTQMSSVISVNTNQSNRLSTIENSISNDQSVNNYSFTLFGLTFKFGKIDVGGALSQKAITFSIPFKYAVNVAFVSCWGNNNSGGGADVGYIVADVNGATITADYANSGGNKTNVYSWLVIGM
ncbi:YadA-like_family protein [Hexamita inflata]|uniref:YadA-like family protein n=1 Tax=Hexamita inflata TaxID=28002 RepID=A0AA86ND21_9EUKA|nr:YadA-like family protein [Hexamita inflata]CAI9956411.1 YadA-like family protein [Hexamita inflata]